jgi:hypothetical protein
MKARNAEASFWESQSGSQAGTCVAQVLARSGVEVQSVCSRSVSWEQEWAWVVVPAGHLAHVSYQLLQPLAPSQLDLVQSNVRTGS